MLPSFRLIGITFLCGFAAVFAGLRLAASFNGAVPMTTAHGGAHVLAATDGEVHLASAPAMFDTRFAIAAAPTVQVRATPSGLQRPSLPLSVMPPQETAADALPLVAVTGSIKQPNTADGALAAVQSALPADSGTPADAAVPALRDAPLAADPQP